MQIRTVGIAEGQRGLEVCDRLPVGEDRLGAIGRLPIGLGSLGGPTGRPLVAGDEIEPPKIVATGSGQIEAQRIGRPSVEQAATREAGHLVRGVAQATVAEVVADRARRRRADLAHDPAPHELLDGIDGLLLGSTAGVAQRPEIEGATDDRRGRQDLGGRLADRRDPLRNSSWTPRGTSPVTGSSLARASTTWRGRPSESATRASTSRSSGELAGRAAPTRTAIAERSRRSRVTTVASGTRVSSSAGEPLRGQVLASPGHEQRDRPIAQSTGEEGDDLASGSIGVVEVIDPDDAGDGAGGEGRQRIRDGVEQADTRARPVGRCATIRTQGRRQVDQATDLRQCV